MSALLRQMAGTGPVDGRHVVVTAHADDESISLGGAPSRLSDVRIVQLTGTPARCEERARAFTAAGWPWPVVDCGMRDRTVHEHLEQLLPIVTAAVADADVVWTHPYEGGHLDHDSAAWLVQQACGRRPILRMEFASYHCNRLSQTFGDFWPNPSVASVLVTLTGEVLARKQAAIAAYESQAAILRKFPAPDQEANRVAPVYDFTKPSAPPRCRWDVKGYLPSTADWRRKVARATREVFV